MTKQLRPITTWSHVDAQCLDCGHHVSWHLPDRQGCVVHACGCRLVLVVGELVEYKHQPRPQGFVWPRV